MSEARFGAPDMLLSPNMISHVKKRKRFITGKTRPGSSQRLNFITGPYSDMYPNRLAFRISASGTANKRGFQKYERQTGIRRNLE